jgi:hypothetical protein
MNLDKLLGIFAFIIAGMLVFSAILAFTEGHYLLGAIRVMLMILNCWVGWGDLKSGFAKED